MKTQKMLIAILVSFVVMFVLAGVFHLGIMKDYFIQQLGPMSSIQFALTSYLILAVVMAYIYGKHWNRSGNLIANGLVFGILMGLMCRVPWEILEIGYGRGNFNFVMTEGIWHMVEEGVGGIMIAIVYGKV
jgi:uncharacterized membrane protein YoaK (UPF0700 family)